jgi:hypothetical protein
MAHDRGVLAISAPHVIGFACHGSNGKRPGRSRVAQPQPDSAVATVLRASSIGATRAASASWCFGSGRKNALEVGGQDDPAGGPEGHPLARDSPGEHQPARHADLALVFEPGDPDGAIVTGPPGVRRFRMEAIGVPAHSGVEPVKGRNAIQEQAMRRLAEPTGLGPTESPSTRRRLDT